MRMNAADIVIKALAARTFVEAVALQALISSAVGARHQRPLGDRWNNFGLISGAGGSFDHKIIENVTNMQDAVLERAALERYGSLDTVPFANPRDAARELLADRLRPDDVTAEFYEAGEPAKTSRQITAIFRDHGCGMTASQIPRTIFALGSSHKEDVNWLQGAFGLGGETTYRNAKAVILVTRRAPSLLREEETDRIAVAVLLWERHGKNESAYYLVTAPWSNPGDIAETYSIPASEYPDFEPGTHIGLISYGVEGFHRARSGGDDRTFEAILNTRLFRPITHVRFTNRIIADRADRSDNLRGLEKRLIDNPRPERIEGAETLPYNLARRTYHLPIKFYVFSKPGESGERRNFVAHDHAVLFISNGQVHYHWTPQEFRYKTRLNKLYDRILVVVETDELPIDVRTSLFTADRSQLVRNDHAVQLEEAVVGFLDEWEQLKQINGALIRDTLTSRSDSRPTINVAKQISRALTIRGFSLTGTGDSGGGKGRSGGRTAEPIELLNDPTYLKGPKHVIAFEGKTKFLTYVVNAVDDFIPNRGKLLISTTHPDLREREITAGNLRGGRLRVSVAIPMGAAKGSFEIKAVLADWLRASGGVGTAMECATTIEVVPEEQKPPRAAGDTSGSGGSKEGNLVALLWQSHESQEGWDKTTVGEVEMVAATDLAKAAVEYAELKSLGDAPVPTLRLNQDYYGLKRYLDTRARDLQQEGIDRVRDRYAVGVGVGLCMLFNEIEIRRKKSQQIPEDWLKSTREALARSVLSMMPAFDDLAREAGIEEF